MEEVTVHIQSSEQTTPVSTTPVAPSAELPAHVADLAQAREKCKRRRVQQVPPNTGHGLNRYAYLDAILGDRNLTQAERQVLTALWKRTQDEGALYAWPSAATLAADVGLRWERDARRHLANLRAKGYLEDMGPGTWAHLVPRVEPGRDVTTLHILALPCATAEDTPEAGGVGTAPRGGVGTAPRGGVGTAPTQTTKGTNHSTTNENPAAATATPPAVSGFVDNSIRYGRDGYDADGKPWESTVKAAFIDWANATTDAQAETALEKVLELIAARNGEEVADWARDFWSWGESRALAIALAPSLDDAQYEAGALYTRLLNAAAADYVHPVTVENPPRVHRQQPVAAVDRDAETLAQLNAEAEAAAARGDLLPEFAEFYAQRENAAPLSPPPFPVREAEGNDAAAELERAAQAQRDLAARVAQQEAEDRRRQARARLDARYEAEAAKQAAQQQPAPEPVTLMDWTELEAPDTVSPHDWAEAAALFATVPSSLDDFTAPAPGPELEDATEPTPEDRAEFIRLFLVSDTGHHAPGPYQDSTPGTPWAVRKVPA